MWLLKCGIFFKQKGISCPFISAKPNNTFLQTLQTNWVRAVLADEGEGGDGPFY